MEGKWLLLLLGPGAWGGWSQVSILEQSFQKALKFGMEMAETVGGIQTNTGKAGEQTDRQGRGFYMDLSLIHISEPTRPY